MLPQPIHKALNYSVYRLQENADPPVIFEAADNLYSNQTSEERFPWEIHPSEMLVSLQFAVNKGSDRLWPRQRSPHHIS